ncbi:hypothetical protein KJS94_04740 [Flavihumibacter rivuli]|uniref:hypothetical protein n=1 Tax=Flavihumibacter rivuli TaxID=2838156 RepID=UPI001BDF6BE7|nr:hypothetical protein [Flavihumibacter rivuli]ULQ57505.1 hypothetical protein KJS94_04740 [Flavihumibacter rivuli]
MNQQLYFNDQAYIAEKFQLIEDHLKDTSKMAVLKIRNWKLVEHLPETSKRYQKHMEQTLFNIVPNEFILCEVGYHFASHFN